MSQVLENIDYYKILQAILIIGGATWLARYSTGRISEFAKRYTRHRHWLMNTSAILRFVLFIGATVLAATTLFNFTKEALIASAGAIALTFSLAFQDLASSFVGGITLPNCLRGRYQVRSFVIAFIVSPLGMEALWCEA